MHINTHNVEVLVCMLLLCVCPHTYKGGRTILLCTDLCLQHESTCEGSHYARVCPRGSARRGEENEEGVGEQGASVKPAAMTLTLRQGTTQKRNLLRPLENQSAENCVPREMIAVK